MGRDKAPPPVKGPPPPPEPDVVFKRPPKGHKQRGAGTVITAKAPVVTRDGILLKAHERLPCQLLSEHCQKEKRPSPKYNFAPPGTHRYRVFLADTKNSKNDLTFCPMQVSFESDAVGRDFAALLALFHFQKSLPLERKMPEPYSTTWTEMLAAEKEAKQSSRKSTKPVQVAPSLASNTTPVTRATPVTGSKKEATGPERVSSSTPVVTVPSLPNDK